MTHGHKNRLSAMCVFPSVFNDLARSSKLSLLYFQMVDLTPIRCVDSVACMPLPGNSKSKFLIHPFTCIFLEAGTPCPVGSALRPFEQRTMNEGPEREDPWPDEPGGLRTMRSVGSGSSPCSQATAPRPFHNLLFPHSTCRSRKRSTARFPI
jgi:hypothetical protein